MFPVYFLIWYVRKSYLGSIYMPHTVDNLYLQPRWNYKNQYMYTNGQIYQVTGIYDILTFQFVFDIFIKNNTLSNSDNLTCTFFTQHNPDIDGSPVGIWNLC